MPLKSGLQLYTYTFTGTIAAPTGYTLVPNVRDEALDMDKTEVDASSRASTWIRQFVPGLANGNIETQIMHLPDDPEWIKIKDAFFNNTILLMAFVDNPLQDSDARHGETFPLDAWGLFGAFYVTNFSEARAMEEAHMHDIRFSPTLEPSTNEPPVYKSINVTATP